MTVSTQRTYIGYAGNGTTTNFAVPFPLLDDGDLIVTLVVAADGTRTRQTLGTAYRIDRDGAAQGGTVVFTTAPPAGVRLEIERATARTQPIDLTPGAVLPADTIETGLDRTTLIAQELSAFQNRTLAAPIAEGRTAPLTLPNVTGRANRILAFNANGDPALTGSITAVQEVGAALTAAQTAQAAAESAQAQAQTAETTATQAATDAQAAARTARGVPDPQGHNGKFLIVENNAPHWLDLPGSSVESSIAATLSSIRADVTRLTHDALLAQVSGLVDATQVGKLGRFGYVPLTDSTRLADSSGLQFGTSGAFRAAEEEIWPSTAATNPAAFDTYVAAANFRSAHGYWYRGVYGSHASRSTYGFSSFVGNASLEMPTTAGGRASLSTAGALNGTNIRSRIGPNYRTGLYGSPNFVSLLGANRPLMFAWWWRYSPNYASTAHVYATNPAYHRFPSRLTVNFHDPLLAPDIDVPGSVAFVRDTIIPKTYYNTTALLQSGTHTFLTELARAGQRVRLVNQGEVSVTLPTPDAVTLTGVTTSSYTYLLFFRGPIYDNRDVFYRFRLFRPVNSTVAGTLTTQAHTAPATPSSVDVYVLVESSTSFAPAGDLTAEASRDDGTTFSAGTTWTDIGALAGGRLWCATVDVSSQPEGQAVKAKLTLAATVPADVKLRLITFGGAAV